MKLFGCLFTVMLVIPTQSVQILSIPKGVNSNQDCAQTCSGVGKYDGPEAEQWRPSWKSATIMKFNIMGCSFKSAPVVTVSVRGDYRSNCPNIRIESVDARTFTIITVEEVTVDQMVSWGCDVYWIATGFTCPSGINFYNSG